MYKNMYLTPTFSAKAVTAGVLFTVEGEDTLVVGGKVVGLHGESVMCSWRGQTHCFFNAGGVLDFILVEEAAEFPY